MNSVAPAAGTSENTARTPSAVPRGTTLRAVTPPNLTTRGIARGERSLLSICAATAIPWPPGLMRSVVTLVIFIVTPSKRRDLDVVDEQVPVRRRDLDLDLHHAAKIDARERGHRYPECFETQRGHVLPRRQFMEKRFSYARAEAATGYG